jgi:hypothetical protein
MSLMALCSTRPSLSAASDGLNTMLRWQGCQDDLAFGLDAGTCERTVQEGHWILRGLDMACAWGLGVSTWLVHGV